MVVQCNVTSIHEYINVKRRQTSSTTTNNDLLNTAFFMSESSYAESIQSEKSFSVVPYVIRRSTSRSTNMLISFSEEKLMNSFHVRWPILDKHVLPFLAKIVIVFGTVFLLCISGFSDMFNMFAAWLLNVFLCY